MKKWILAFLLLSALGVAAVAAWRYLLPERHVSDLYRRYEHADGIAASYIHNFPVNDTVFVDVTLLETKDTALWDSLCKDFGIALFSMYPKEYREIMSIEHSFGQQVIKDTIVLENDSLYKENLIIFSHINMSMCIFHKINDSQYDAIVNEKHKEITS